MQFTQYLLLPIKGKSLGTWFPLSENQKHSIFLLSAFFFLTDTFRPTYFSQEVAYTLKS